MLSFSKTLHLFSVFTKTKYHLHTFHPFHNVPGAVLHKFHMDSLELLEFVVSTPAFPFCNAEVYITEKIEGA